MRVGGPAGQIVEPTTSDALVEAARQAWAAGGEWLVLGGGSNLVVGDAGFDGTVIRVLTRGIEEVPTDTESADTENADTNNADTNNADTNNADTKNTVRLRIQAGEPWDAVAAYAVDRGLAGIEALSGIPGSTGAAPIQNIGAYGQDLAAVLVAVDFLDEETGERGRLLPADLELGYRTSVLKQSRRGVVISVDLELIDSAGESGPIEYDQLAGALDVELWATAPLARVRDAVRQLRAAKGMLIDPEDPVDPDSVSAGSFFTNPIVSNEFARALPGDVSRWPGDDGMTKLSAAWLIEHSGIRRGFSLPGSRAAVSSKHTLAIVNTGGATAEQVAELARYLQTRVLTAYGVILQPEPILIGLEL
jgi:UDP-N-acetylmuramate dehydrogenase